MLGKMKMLREKNGEGKISSKRAWGTILLASGLGMTIASGLGWYDPIVDLVKATFWMGSALLGIGVFKKDGGSEPAN